MSYDESDYRYDEYMAELYEEHKGYAIEEFKAERLQSYYSANPALAEPAFRSLLEGRRLFATSATASTILAAVAAEYFVKRVLLHPIVHGLVNDDPTAALIAGLVVSQNGIERFRDLLFAVLDDVAGIALLKHRRDGATRPLWEELTELQKCRNGLVHRAEAATRDDAAFALAVAGELLEKVFPMVVISVGLHLHSDGLVCADQRCIMEERLEKAAKQSSLDISKPGLP